MTLKIKAQKQKISLNYTKFDDLTEGIWKQVNDSYECYLVVDNRGHKIYVDLEEMVVEVAEPDAWLDDGFVKFNGSIVLG